MGLFLSLCVFLLVSIYSPLAISPSTLNPTHLFVEISCRSNLHPSCSLSLFLSLFISVCVCEGEDKSHARTKSRKAGAAGSASGQSKTATEVFAL